MSRKSEPARIFFANVAALKASVDGGNDQQVDSNDNGQNEAGAIGEHRVIDDAHTSRAPPSKPRAKQVKEARKTAAPGPRLLSKREIVAICGKSYPCIWKWMRKGLFPRPRVLPGGESGWLEAEVFGWLSGLPMREYKPVEGINSVETEA